MNILLNGEGYTVEETKQLSGLLTNLELSPDIVSVHVNGRHVTRVEFDELVLQENDKVEILLFMGGGI